MQEIDKRATSILLAELDNEINIKCNELNKKHREMKQKKIFFTSCFAVIIIFLLQMIFGIFNMNIIFSILIYQAIVLVLIVPAIFDSKVYGRK